MNKLLNNVGGKVLLFSLGAYSGAFLFYKNISFNKANNPSDKLEEKELYDRVREIANSGKVTDIEKYNMLMALKNRSNADIANQYNLYEERRSKKIK